MKSERSTLYLTASIAGLIILYFLSPPFVFALMVRGHATPEAFNVCLVIYQPASWLAGHFPPYQAFEIHMLDLLGVPIVPSRT